MYIHVVGIHGLALPLLPICMYVLLFLLFTCTSLQLNTKSILAGKLMQVYTHVHPVPSWTLQCDSDVHMELNPLSTCRECGP